MSRLIPPESLARLYRIAPQSVASDLLPSVMDELRPQDELRFASDVTRRRPKTDREARALMNCFYRLEPQHRRTFAAMELVFACEALISPHDVKLALQ